MKNKKELDIFKSNILQKQNKSMQSFAYMLFSNGLPLLSPIVFNYFSKKISIKNKIIKSFVSKAITFGIPFIMIKLFLVRK